ncbi:MAG TPA: SMC-Scp complex subunit ScpB [Chromatiaceae bacterium]|nr:SMC-Scp complex subunit ScpB [Chromatiaceae bacterium]
MTKPPLKVICEGALLAAGGPLTLDQILALFLDEERPSREDIHAAIAALRQDCEGRALELTEVAGGWRLQVRREIAPWVGRLWDERPQRYSRALLETLALIAYRQPITRGEIEDIRGVAVNSQIVKTLMEREWIRVVGHRDVPGRPALLATTRRFLDYFGLRSLNDLPPLAEIRDPSFLGEDLGGADGIMGDLFASLALVPAPDPDAALEETPDPSPPPAQLRPPEIDHD